MPARVAIPAGDEELRELAARILDGPDYARWHPARWLRELLQWLGELSERSPGLYWALIGGLAVVTALLSIQVLRAMRRTLRERAPRAPGRPAPPEPTFAAEAEALAAAGRFLEAAHRVQLAVIDLLLRTRVLELGRADANRTLRERLRRAALPDDARADLLALIDRFERAWFRDRDDDPRLYDAWRGLHARLAGSSRSA